MLFTNTDNLYTHMVLRYVITQLFYHEQDVKQGLSRVQLVFFLLDLPRFKNPICPTINL